MGWSPASERFQFYSDIWRCRKLPWMEKWRRVLHRQCYFFFLCCLFKQNDKSYTFHDGLSAVWPLDPGRILGRDGSHVWPGASWRNSLRYQSPCEISMTVVHLAKLKISVPDIYIIYNSNGPRVQKTETSLARGSINRSCCNADHTDCSIYYFYYVKPEKVHVNKYNTQSVRSAVCMHGLSEHCTHRVFVCASKAVNYTFCPSLPGNKFSLASKLSRYNVIECVIIAEK